jgi:hypothetical protein
MASLAEIRAKLQASSQQGANSSGGDNAIYPHWNIAEGNTATVRFLPDGDNSNTFFWVERAMINLPFAGIEGETNSKPVTVQVPCMEMWGESCPILTEIRPWFKVGDKALEDKAKGYWKKKSYLFQGFVVDSKLQEDGKVPENPIRRFIISTQIFNIIKAALMDPEMEESPTDYVRGVDFRITKTTKGQYADYSTSNWARRERAIGEGEQAAIKQFGLFNLKEFLPKKPTDVEIKVMKEMFEASVNGEAYSPERWSQYFKPKNYQVKAVSAPVVVPMVATAAVIDEDNVPFESAPAPKAATASPATAPVTEGASARAQDILAKIRRTQQQQQ